MTYNLEKSQAVTRATGVLERAATHARELPVDAAADYVLDAAVAAIKLVELFTERIVDEELDVVVFVEDL